jgi:hypothetical protein
MNQFIKENVMKPVGQVLTNRILKNGQVINFIETPKGNMTITELIESRGSSTNYMHRSFKYVSLPDERNKFFSITSEMENHWKSAGFIS